jgi:hypothetical protein
MNKSHAEVQAPGPVAFELHTLGWRSFQDLCAAVLREVWGQSVQPFADSRDGGRDGAFYGRWNSGPGSYDLPQGPFVFQCKFIARRDKTLSLSGVADELAKIARLVSLGICESYVLVTNARVTGTSEQVIRQAIANQGVAFPLVLGGQWLNQTIAQNRRLRMFVPRVYGLGDLSQILDERAYDQARALLDFLQEDLSTFVVTEAYRRAARAIEEHGFCLLLGEPAVGKSVIAAVLAMTALDHWRSLTIRADGPADIVTHWNPSEPGQFFWLDDAFGAVRHERSLTDDWSRRLPKVMAAVKGGAKVVLTSRDYIYRDARKLLKEYAYPLLREQQVVIDVAQLTHQERQQILYNHIRLGDQPKDVRAKLKPHLASAADQLPFRPEVARRLGTQAFTKGLTIASQPIKDFMARPNKFLQDIYEGLEPDHIGALAMVYQAGALAIPLLSTTDERKDLLALVGSEPNRVGQALPVLEGTFLRCAPQPGAPDIEKYWSFRHPTLREGFATFIADNPNLIKILIQGLDDDGILGQLDCGSDDTRGTLIAVPSALYQLVAERVSKIRFERGSETWRWIDRQNSFLANRCSTSFLRQYLGIDIELISRCLRIGPYMSSDSGLPVLATLHSAGLLPEGNRLKALTEVGELAIDWPDSDWLDIKSLETLFTDEERAGLLERVKLELIPNLNGLYWNWHSNEQGDSADEYYKPLEDALERYAEAFSDDAVTRLALEAALVKVEEMRLKADYWTDEDGNPKYPPLSTADRSASAEDLSPALSLRSVRDADVRSIFDDVDS